MQEDRFNQTSSVIESNQVENVRRLDRQKDQVVNQPSGLDMLSS